MTYKHFFFLLLLFAHFQLFAGSYPVREITITGNEQTKDFVILREMLISKDSLYSPSGAGNITELLKLSRDRILNLNLFNEVVISKKLITNNDKASFTIAIEVIEKWFVWPIPFIEFSDRNFNVWGNLAFDPERTNYGLYVFNYNLFGRNHTLKTKLKTGYNTKLGLEYRIPFLSKNTQWGLNGLIDYSSQNEVWYETRNDSLQFYRNGSKNLIRNTEAKLELTKRISPFTRVFYGIHFTHGQLANSVPTNDYFLNNQRYQRNYGINLKVEHDKRNNIYFPTLGKYSSLSLGINTWQNNSTLLNGSIETRLQSFDQLSSKWSSALSVYLQYNTATNAPYSDRKLLGYKETVRGYEHYVVDGTFGIKTNAALRYHILSSNVNLKFIPIDNYKKLPLNIYAEGYIDGGYAKYTNSDISNDFNGQVLYSAGLGLNTLLYNDRLLRLEYSLNSIGEGGFFVHFKKAI